MVRLQLRTSQASLPGSSKWRTRLDSAQIPITLIQSPSPDSISDAIEEAYF